MSVDAQSEAPVQSCLSNGQGNVARYNDNEAYVAADPRDADRLIAVWQTVSGRGSVMQWTRSADGGKTWTAPRAAPIIACAGGPVADATRASDPWATFGPDGRVYRGSSRLVPASSRRTVVRPTSSRRQLVVRRLDADSAWSSVESEQSCLL